MPRQERYSYSPQTQAQLIDYSPVDYSAGDALALQYLGERNKAYNEAEAMPTAFSSAVGDMRFSNNDRATIDKHIQRINEDINKEVNEKYNGDYALAKSAIAKKLMGSKNIFNIAQQNYELEAKARDQVNNLIAIGKGPTEFVDDGKGNMVRRNITADELFAGKSVFDSQGNIKGLPNYEIYSAGEHDKWVEDAYSKALNAATSPETISKDPRAVGYLRVAKARGMSDEDVQNYMFGKDGNLNPTGQSIVDTFLKDSPQAAREFAKIKDPNLIGKYVANIIKGQTAKVSDSQFMQDLEWREANKDEGNGDKKKTISKGVIFEGGIAPTQTPFTPETFYDKSPNARNKIISSQINEPLKSTDNPFNLYKEGLIDVHGLQAYSIENSLRSKDKDLRNYYRVGSKDNDKIAKEMGFKSASDLENARSKYKQAEYKKTGLSEGLLAISKASPAYVSPGSNIFERYDKAVKNRNLAAAKYSSRLRDLSTNYIKENKLDSDYDINFYQPNFADDKVTSASTAFNENIRAGYTKPGQFKFLDDNGGMKNKTSDELNRSYTDETEKFEVSGVGGNSETGLIWKVKNPDGTVSNATWNTGYEKKMSALVNIYGVPELIDVLNSEAVKFDEAGNIKPGMPDVPVEFTRNVNTFKLKEEPYANDPRFHYIKQGDNYLVVNSDQNGNYRLTSTKNKNEATALPKHRIFEIITSLQ